MNDFYLSESFQRNAFFLLIKRYPVGGTVFKLPVMLEEKLGFSVACPKKQGLVKKIVIGDYWETIGM